MYKHQLVATLLLSFLSLTALATDRYVDPSIWPATLPNYYMTVTQALNAAQSGDRIFIAPGAYATPDITISQNIEIYSMDTTDVVQLYKYGNLTTRTDINVNCSDGMKVLFKGIRVGKIWYNGAKGSKLDIRMVDAQSVIGQTTSSILTQRAKLNIFDSRLFTLNIASNFYDVNLIHTAITLTARFRYGSIVCSNINYLFVYDELNGGLNNDTINKILIAADTIYYLGYQNDDYKLVLANNLLGQTFITAWNYYSGNINKILNNEFTLSNALLNLAINNVPRYNFDISNNIFPSTPIFYNGATMTYINSGWAAWPINYFPIIQGNPGILPHPNLGGDPNHFSGGFQAVSRPQPFVSNYNGLYGFTCDYSLYDLDGGLWGTQNVFYLNSTGCDTSANYKFPNNDAPGFFRWTYNGFAIPGTGSSPGNLTFINIPGTTNIGNAGNPAAEYTDIDLTRNDRGRLGGPYSILNYNPANPNNSKAFIFDLDIPTQFSPASPSINIQAKGYHRN